jgi:hypothetical protein
MRINHPEWYPCYINPSFDELIELAKSGWDTCRILVPYSDQNNNDIVIASGYGNTHDSIQNRYFIHLGATLIEKEVDGRIRYRWKTNGKRLPSMNTYILYHDYTGIAYMNLEDTGGSDKARYEKWDLDDNHLEILKDLIRESGLAL